jgi:hypothetical protein
VLRRITGPRRERGDQRKVLFQKSEEKRQIRRHRNRV